MIQLCGAKAQPRSSCLDLSFGSVGLGCTLLGYTLSMAQYIQAYSQLPQGMFP